MSRTLNTNFELFAAAMYQTEVKACYKDAGELKGIGVVQEITPETVKLREADGSFMHNFKFNTMFKA